MHKLFLIAFFVVLSIKANATIVYASEFDWNANDATGAFQSAVNSTADTIVINKQSGDWITRPNIFFDLSDKTIIFEAGVVFRAKTGAFAGSGDCLLKFVRGNNIKVIGYGATFLMNKAEYAAMADSEWRHSLSIKNSGNIRKPADSYLTSFDDCVFLNVSQDVTNKYNTPIWIEVSDYSKPCPRFGGAEFNDCLLSYSTNLNFLGSYGEINTSPGMGNVKLINLTVINPNSSVTMNVTDGGGSPDTTCIFDYKKYTSPPSTSVTLSAQNRIIECSGLNGTLESNRTSDNKSFPVAVSYLIDGTAMQGEDFSMMNGFMIIPSDNDYAQDTIYVLSDKSAEGAKCIITTLKANSLFTSASLPLFIFVYDCITGINDTPGDSKFRIFPNPAHDFVEIDFDEDYQGLIEVYNEHGQKVYSQKENDRINIINTSGFSKGIYFIKIQPDDKIHIQKIIKL